MRKENCLTCKYYQGQQCYRYPPTTSPESPTGKSTYPFMLHPTWCGEWVEDETLLNDDR